MSSNNHSSKTDESLLYQDEAAFLMPFVDAAEQSKSSNIATIRSIVMKLLSEPNIFCGYDQVKAILQPGIDAGGSEGAKLSQSLDLFSYGTFSDYQKDPSQYLDLTGAQLVKLRQLSALSVVQHACTHVLPQRKDGLAMIPYKAFEEALLLNDNPREVEDILVSCLYAGVFRGKLCQESRSLHLSARHPIRPRDVPISQISEMMSQIQKIQSSLQTAKQGLDAKNHQVAGEAQAMSAFWSQVEERRKKNESNTVMRWDNDASFGGADAAGTTRRQKRGRNNNDPSSTFGRFQS